jgi:hypothetical protein
VSLYVSQHGITHDGWLDSSLHVNRLHLVASPRIPDLVCVALSFQQLWLVVHIHIAGRPDLCTQSSHIIAINMPAYTQALAGWSQRSGLMREGRGEARDRPNAPVWDR